MLAVAVCSLDEWQLIGKRFECPVISPLPFTLISSKPQTVIWVALTAGHNNRKRMPLRPNSERRAEWITCAKTVAASAAPMDQFSHIYQRAKPNRSAPTWGIDVLWCVSLRLPLRDKWSSESGIINFSVDTKSVCIEIQWHPLKWSVGRQPG